MGKIFEPVFKNIFDGVFPQGFLPFSLFSNGEQGAWIDPSDLAALFQDFAGVTKVTAAGQSIGLALDKSKNLALGAERVSNGDFSSGLTGWTTGSAVTSSVTSGEVQLTFGGSAALSVNNWFSQASILFDVNKTYKVTFDATTVSGGVLQVSSGFNVQATIAANGGVKTSYTVYVRRGTTGSTANQQALVFAGAAGAVWRIDNVSVKEIAGNHAIQATSGDRPVYASDKAFQNVSSDTLNWIAPTGTYTIAYRGSAGTVILDTQALSGSTNVMLDTKVYSYVAVNRVLGSVERQKLKQYLDNIVA